MKTLKWTLPVLIGALVLFSAIASAQTVVLRAEIPFPFIAGDRALPAGEYIIRVDRPVVELRSPSTDPCVLLANAGYAFAKTGQPARLVFNTYGKTNVLRSVWTRNSDRGTAFPEPAAERELQATVGTTPVKTTVAAIPTLSR